MITKTEITKNIVTIYGVEFLQWNILGPVFYFEYAERLIEIFHEGARFGYQYSLNGEIIHDSHGFDVPFAALLDAKDSIDFDIEDEASVTSDNVQILS